MECGAWTPLFIAPKSDEGGWDGAERLGWHLLQINNLKSQSK
jgi:hypothetical protein